MRAPLEAAAQAVLLAVVAMATGCVLTSQKPMPVVRDLVREQVHVHSDIPVPADHRLIDELVAQRTEIAETLRIPACTDAVHVHLFESPERYQQFIRTTFPEFPDRRAFFVATEDYRAVYAYWGDRVAEDLRHEVAHAYLHAVIKNLPLWLDEGLAEFFEVPAYRQGLNRPHLELLRALQQQGRWSPSLTRLEALHEPRQMAQADYAEAWAWVDWLLTTTPERRDLLSDHLARQRVTGSAPPLSEVLRRADSGCDAALVAHLAALESLVGRSPAAGDAVRSTR